MKGRERTSEPPSRFDYRIPGLGIQRLNQNFARNIYTRFQISSWMLPKIHLVVTGLKYHLEIVENGLKKLNFHLCNKNALSFQVWKELKKIK